VELEELPFVTYKGRTDNRFKRQGHFVDLYDLEHRLASIPFVENVVCFADFGRIYVVIIFLRNFSLAQLEEHRRKLFSEIQMRIPIRSLPDHVTVLYPQDIPLTPSGKFDVKRVKALVLEKKLRSLEGHHIHYDGGDVESILSSAWELFGGIRSQPSSDSQFLEDGGDSMKVMQFVEYVFQELNLFGTYLQQVHSPEMIRILFSSNFSSLVNFVRNVILPQLDHQVSVSTFTQDSVLNSKRDVDHPPQFKPDPQTNESVEARSEELEPRLSLSMTENIPAPQLEQYPYPNYNTYGCVDSTPILVTHPSKAILVVFESNPELDLVLIFFILLGLGRVVIGTSNSGYTIAVAVTNTSEPNDETPNTDLIWYKKFPDRLVAAAAVSLDQLTLFIGMRN